MLLKILLTFFIVFIASSQPNYQDRVTYYNEQDNVCCNYFTSDFMNLIININNQETIKYKLSGNTRCYIWAIDFLSSISTNDTT